MVPGAAVPVITGKADVGYVSDRLGGQQTQSKVKAPTASIPLDNSGNSGSSLHDKSGAVSCISFLPSIPQRFQL